MAAILPHLAEEDETTELEQRYWDCASEGGLGDAQDPLCPSPQAVVDQSHAALLTVAMTRSTVVDQLRGRTITPRLRDKEVALYIDESVSGPAWNPMMPVDATSLLSWTTKMGAPSFSLPAGASPMAGSCPGANAGQSIVPDNVRRKAARVLLPVLKAPQVELAKSICEFCYAEGGQYATGSVQYHQLVRYAWVRRAVKHDMQGRPVRNPADSEFVQIMIDAINRADFKLREEPPQWQGQRFFRLHDSGDFFSVPYLHAWKAIANHFHPDNNDDPINFWAPTRIWALGPKIIGEVNRLNGEEGSNLAIRPSAYHVNQHGPEDLGPGWAQDSVVYQPDIKVEAEGQTFDWDCKAYAAADGPSCRGAENPDGEVGCRVCWMRPDLRVNYTLH